MDIVDSPQSIVQRKWVGTRPLDQFPTRLLDYSTNYWWAGGKVGRWESGQVGGRLKAKGKGRKAKVGKPCRVQDISCFSHSGTAILAVLVHRLEACATSIDFQTKL